LSNYDYDLFVIGAGSGGVRCARMSASMGARVAIAEERYFGGTCVNVGCVPKKLFVYAAHVREDLHTAASFGWTVENARFHWPTLLENKNREIARLNGIYRSILANAGVDIMEGRATIAAPHQIAFNGRIITARNILIATGGWPVKPDIPGIEHAITSNEFFHLPQLPNTALIVGGGYIAVEFAGILHNLGVQTTLSYRGPLILRGFDQDIRQHVCNAMSAKGIAFQFNHRITALTKLPDGKIQIIDSDGKILAVDCVIMATGRNPNTDGLGLENTAVERDVHGAILVDDRLQTAEPGIFAVGDVINRIQLTPVALAEGMALAHYLFGTGPGQVDYRNIPTAVFSQPSIGTVGLSEEQAREQGFDVVIFRSTFTPMQQSLSDIKEKTLMKLVVDRASDKVLGAHMVGPDAGEIIQGLAIAIRMGATKAQFDQTIGIHPTAAEEFVTMRSPV
jgi:glutathione reductase (NADPH)